MRHVGEEIRLVTARLLEFARLQLNRGIDLFEIVALTFQLLGLFFELGIGLLEFHLLLF
ncbi:hypothetical protein D3C71_1148360 [compost metagenome]